MKKIVVLLIISGFLITGCGSEGEKLQTTQEEKAKPPVSASPVEEGEKKVPSENQISKSGSEMKNAAGKLAEAVEEKTTPILEKTKDATTELVDTIQEKTEPVVEKTKETTIAVVETVKEKTTPLLISTMETATNLTKTATEKVQKIGGNEAKESIPVIVTLDNKQGKIILPHKKHSDSFDCAACHKDGLPGPFSLGKVQGHALCQSCHKEQNAGPSKCTGCHAKKTVRIPPEGC